MDMRQQWRAVFLDCNSSCSSCGSVLYPEEGRLPETGKTGKKRDEERTAPYQETGKEGGKV